MTNRDAADKDTKKNTLYRCAILVLDIWSIRLWPTLQISVIRNHSLMRIFEDRLKFGGFATDRQGSLRQASSEKLRRIDDLSAFRGIMATELMHVA